MGKMEQTLKAEIARLARKQMRATYLPLARDVHRLKQTVSALRKTIAVLARLGTELEAQRTAERAKLAAAPEEVKASRISPGLIRKLRNRLGISQAELATLVGVSTNAVGFWEQGKSRPTDRNKEALVALRKLGRREVARILAAKAEQQAQPVQPERRRKGRRRKA
jgi:DNA-binding transcriptional regulator YiaG